MSKPTEKPSFKETVVNALDLKKPTKEKSQTLTVDSKILDDAFKPLLGDGYHIDMAVDGGEITDLKIEKK